MDDELFGSPLILPPVSRKSKRKSVLGEMKCDDQFADVSKLLALPNRLHLSYFEPMDSWVKSPVI